MQDRSTAERDVEASFETVYQQLEETVSRLEAGGLTLEESIQLYETGMRLARRCKQMLDAAELRVTELQQEFGTDGLDGEPDDETDEETD